MISALLRPWILLLAAITIVAVFPLWIGQFPSTSDMRDVYIPLEDFFQHHQKRGQLPAWQPLAAWGFPAIASGQIGFFYPPLLLARGLLPFPFYLSANTILHLLALSLGAYALARQYKLSQPAAFLASITFTLSGFVWQHFIHLNIFLILPFVPWQLWFTHRLHTKPNLTPRDLSILALLLGTPFLIGQFQIPALTAAVSIVHFLYLRWPHLPSIRHGIRTTIVPLGIAGLLALALTAAQILPTLELLPYSSRSDTSGQFDITRANQYSYPLYHLPTLIFPRFYDTDDNYWGKRLELEYGFFLGTIPLLLALIWAWQYRRSYTREDRFLVFLAIITFLLGLGSLSPFRLVGIEPSLWVFSAPARWLLFTSLALSLLAGRALDSSIFTSRAWHKSITTLATILMVGISLANIGLFSDITTSLADTILTSTGANTPYNQEKITSLLTSARSSSVSLRSPYTYLPLTLIGILLLIKKYHPRTQALAIISLTTLELLIINPPLIVMDNWSEILKVPSSLAALPESIKSQQARIYSIRENTDTGAFFTNPQSRGGAVENQLRTQLLVPLFHTQHHIAGIEWPASLDFASHEPTLNSLRKPNSHELTDVSVAENLNIGAVIAPSKFSLPELTSQSRSITPLDQVVIYQLDPAPRMSLRSQQGQPSGQILSQSISSTGNIQLETEAAQATQLIIRDSFYPGWQATINSQPTPIHQEPPFFRRLNLPPGRNIIALTYYPQSIYRGALVSSLAVVLSLLIIIFTKRPGNDTLNS